MKSWVIALLGVLAGIFVAVAVILVMGSQGSSNGNKPVISLCLTTWWKP